MKMTAYHGKPELKAMMVEEAMKHRAADQLIKGVYEQMDAGKFHGCAVGCTLHSVSVRLGVEVEFSSHAAYEAHLGIPRVLARLEDGIFEQLPNELALTWPQRFLEAAPTGADLSRVGDQFLHWLLVDKVDGVIRFAKTDRTKAAIQAVGDLYAKKLRGEIVTREEWETVRKNADAAYAAAAAADAAAAYAADAYAADAYAADAAADAYAADAAADAYAADAAAARHSARQTARTRQSEKLLELMAAAPVETLAAV